MAAEPGFYRLHYWKNIEGGYATSCSFDDDDVSRIDIECFGRSRVETRHGRLENETTAQFVNRIQQIERLMNAAFVQGQRHRAAVIHEALECRL